MSNVMISTLTAVFGEPKSPNVPAFVAVYIGALKGIPDEILVDASDILIRERRISSWPTPAECLDAVASARKLGRSKGIGLTPIENFDQWYGALMGQIKHADRQADIDAAIAQIEPYARAQWCFPHRLTDARALGAQRSKQLAAGNARNPAGEA